MELLSQWCRHRAMRWHRENGAEAMVLEREPALPPAPRMLLFREDNEFLLRDERCVTLATASDLQALFDAVDGGIGDATFLP